MYLIFLVLHIRTAAVYLYHKFNCFACLLYNSLLNILPLIRILHTYIMLYRYASTRYATFQQNHTTKATHVLTMISVFLLQIFLFVSFLLRAICTKKSGIITRTSEEHLNNNQPSNLGVRDQNNFITIILCQFTRNHCNKICKYKMIN